LLTVSAGTNHGARGGRLHHRGGREHRADRLLRGGPGVREPVQGSPHRELLAHPAAERVGPDLAVPFRG